MLMFFVKRFMLKKLNGLLKDYSSDVDKVRSILDVWISRVEKILNYLKSLLSKIDDGELNENEIEDAISEARSLVEEW